MYSRLSLRSSIQPLLTYQGLCNGFNIMSPRHMLTASNGYVNLLSKIFQSSDEPVSLPAGVGKQHRTQVDARML